MFDKPYLAVEISTSDIKLACGNYINSKLVIKEFSIIPTQKGSAINGSILKPDLILPLIKEKIKTKEFKANRIIFVISSLNSIIREVQLPKSEPKEVEMILKHEAQQFFPVDLKDYVFDYKILEDVETKEGKFTRVLLVAIPIVIVDEYTNLADKLNIKLEAIEVPINCIYKLVIDAGKNELIKLRETANEQNFVIMDIGQAATNVGIFTKTALKNTRLIQGGCNEIVNSIQTDSNHDTIEPEFYRLEEIDLQIESTWYFKSAKVAIDNMFFSVSRFLEFYLSNTFGSISEIYLIGCGCKIKGMIDYSSNYFALTTNILEGGKGIIYKGKHSQEEFQKSFSLLVNVLGAIVR